MRTVDFESQASISQAIDDARPLFGPWEPAEGAYMSETMRLHNPDQHVVVFRTTCLAEAKMIEAVVLAASGIVKEERE